MFDQRKSKYGDVFRIFRMVHGFGRMLAFSTLIRTLSKISVVALPVTTAYLVSHVINGQQLVLFHWVLLLSGLLLLAVALAYLDTYISHDVSFRIVKALQDKMYDHMDRIAPGGLESRNSAESATIILSDINVFEWFVAHCLVEWLGTLFCLIVCLLLLNSVSILAAVAVTSFLLLMLFIPLFSTAQARQKGLQMKQLFGEMNGIVADGILGHKELIGFHATHRFFDRLEESSNAYDQAQHQYNKRSEWEKTWEAIAAGAAILTGLFFSYRQMEKSQISLLIPVFSSIVAAVGCIQSTLSESTNFGFVFGAAARIAAVFNIQSPVHGQGKKTWKNVRLTDGEWQMGFQNVGFSYPGEDTSPILKNVSFSVAASEVVAIVGASGDGKSSLAKLAVRFWDVDCGSIQINHTDIREIALEELRDMITLVPQETYLFDGTIRENLLLIKPNATEAEIEQSLNDAQAMSFVHGLDQGIQTRIGQNGTALSGGERQRLALAQALLKDAPVLILDEATSALDTENELYVHKAIRNHRRGKITIVIAHRVSSMQHADRIVFLKDGCVCAEGTYQYLMETCAAFKDLVRGEYLEDEKA